jgi:hypothetical protein
MERTNSRESRGLVAVSCLRMHAREGRSEAGPGGDGTAMACHKLRPLLQLSGGSDRLEVAQGSKAAL